MLIHLESKILEIVSELEVFNRYFKNGFELSKKYSSPFRRDSDPSFCIFRKTKTSGTNEFLFKDFGTGHTGNCFKLISLIYNISYFESLVKVINDFNIDIPKLEINFYMGLSESDDFSFSKKENSLIVTDFVESPTKPITTIHSQWKAWDEGTYQYFSKYGLSIETLKLYRVYPILWANINGKYIVSYTDDNPMYGFYATNLFGDFIKLYRPLAKLRGYGKKFISNYNRDVISGLEQMTYVKNLYNSDVLIITKSLKDVMVLFELGYCAISPMSETTKLSSRFIDSLKSKFKHIYIFFDNDDTGVNFANSYGLDTIFINDVLTKDISDFVEMYGFYNAKQFMSNAINI
jgi:hypothetical protein